MAWRRLIDEVSVWNVARTQAQIQDGMNSGLCDRAGLVAYFQFEGGSLDSSVGPFSGSAPHGYGTGAGVAVSPCDSDGDGFADDVDLFPSSDNSATVAIGTCNSGVLNAQAGFGANFMDLIGAAAAGAGNHGQFVSAVTQMASGWQRLGLISGKDKGKITSCAARSSIGK